MNSLPSGSVFDKVRFGTATASVLAGAFAGVLLGETPWTSVRPGGSDTGFIGTGESIWARRNTAQVQVEDRAEISSAVAE